MRWLRWLALPSFLLAGCGPLGDADAPAEEERPCHTDADCEMHSGESLTRQALCSSPAMGSRGGQTDVSGKDAAACGPMPNMRSRAVEPDLLCFRGTCVPVTRQR